MTSYRTRLLSATAVAALLGAAPAFAFEEVDWTWDKTITENVTIDIDINTTVDPDGLVQVEKLQMHFGDISATSEVTGVHNTPASGGGTATINETFTFNGIVNDEADPSVFPETVGTGGTELTATLVDPSTLDEGSDEFTLTVEVTGEVDVPADEAVDAADLPKIANSATAVSNNQSIEADVPLYLHDAQFAAGGFNPTCGGGGEANTSSNYGCPDAFGFLIGAYLLTEVDDELEDLNEHTSIAGLMTIAAATGFINAAEITATANVSDVLNAYVENSATAVTNNASFTVESDVTDNHVVVADLTQWGYANVTASASVTDVELNGYTGFGGADLGGGGDITPVVSSSATAVGNNLSIKVGGISTD
jgi:hypothetical protein